MTTVYVECVVRNKIATITLNNPPLKKVQLPVTRVSCKTGDLYCVAGCQLNHFG